MTCDESHADINVATRCTCEIIRLLINKRASVITVGHTAGGVANLCPWTGIYPRLSDCGLHGNRKCDPCQHKGQPRVRSHQVRRALRNAITRGYFVAVGMRAVFVIN